MMSSATNNTANGTAQAVAANDDMMILLTFGPLSSCLSLPNLTAKPLPSTTNLSSSAQQQLVQAWISSLPQTGSCSSFAWSFKPDYTEQLSALATFQSQLEKLFPSINSSSGTGIVLEKQPVGPAGVVNTTASAPPTTSAGPTASASSLMLPPSSTSDNSSTDFFGGNNAASSSLLGSSSSSGVTPPTNLPAWIGVSLGCIVIIHLAALILHVCSELETLFPSWAAKMQQSSTDIPLLPSHASPSNESSATLVDSKTSPADIKADAKAVDPPQYNEPAPMVTDTPVATTPAVVRYSRKAKRFVVPLLLVSALASVGIAVVLNSKFATGPVGDLPGSVAFLTPPLAPLVNGSSSMVSNATAISSIVSSSLVPSDASTSNSHHRDSIAKTDSDMTTLTTSQDIKASATPSSVVDASAAAPSTSPTMSMTKLVKRQTNFFPTPSASSSTPIVPKPSATSPSSDSLAPSPTSPTTRLFPTLPSTSLSTSTTVLPTSVPSSPTPFPTQPAPTTSPTTPQTSDTNSNSNNTPLFVMSKSSSMHRLWWIVMLDLILWFAQRRRTRTQTTMDKARAAVLFEIKARTLAGASAKI